MKKLSAGIIVYRKKGNSVEVLIAHMGSPWWANKDIGAWTVPKGGLEEGEQPLDAARREFQEELSLSLPEGELIELGEVDQHNNKTVIAWAIEGNPDISNIRSNTVELEWPPRSGKKQEFPEVDRAAWLSLSEAAQKTVRGQSELFNRLAEKLGLEFDPSDTKKPEQSSLF